MVKIEFSEVLSRIRSHIARLKLTNDEVESLAHSISNSRLINRVTQLSSKELLELWALLDKTRDKQELDAKIYSPIKWHRISPKKAVTYLTIKWQSPVLISAKNSLSVAELKSGLIQAEKKYLCESNRLGEYRLPISDF